ncbi:hypothetical protein ACFL2E_10625 [Thermodesulfobacteriota bacterium]
MKNTEVRQSLSGNTRKDYQETRLTFDSVLRLHGVKELPFLDTPELQNFAIEGTEDLLSRHGPEWIKQHRVRLIEELELISEM